MRIIANLLAEKVCLSTKFTENQLSFEKMGVSIKIKKIFSFLPLLDYFLRN